MFSLSIYFSCIFTTKSSTFLFRELKRGVIKTLWFSVPFSVELCGKIRIENAGYLVMTTYLHPAF
jgi:hypothetical protein